MELTDVRLEIPENGNIIVGQSHFIKTVEDLYEAIVNTVPQMKFGVAFNEASGACLTRVDGNDADLKANATRNAQAIGAGHTFVIAMRDGYPINVLGRIRDIPGDVLDFLRDRESGGSDRRGDGAGQGSAGRDRRQLAEGRRDGDGRRMAARACCARSGISASAPVCREAPARRRWAPTPFPTIAAG